MAENTKIEWADHTFNPWVGCTKVSPACDHCYAEGWAKRAGQANLWAGERRRTSAANWQQPVKWNRQAEREGRRFRVFCASLADVFDNQVPEAWRDALWRMILDTPNLDWLLLTKRPQNIAKMMPPEVRGHPSEGPLHNLWLGTTVENQAEAERRIPHLLAVPAAVHFLSCEPLLGPMNLKLPDDDECCCDHEARAFFGAQPATMQAATHTPLCPHSNRIDWVIAGGESGPGARPMHPDWARSLRDQCKAAGVAFNFKQHGAWVQHKHPTHWLGEAGTLREVGQGVWASDIGVRMVGKAAAGRLLDGVEHNGMPGGVA